MTVYLLWLHDMVLGVYAQQKDARRAALEFRKKNNDYKWKGHRGCGTERWHQTLPISRTGWTSAPTIARLEIESREVE